MTHEVAASGLTLSSGETILVIVGLIVAALLILFSTRSKQTKSDLLGSVTALQGEDTVNKSKISRLEEQNASQAAHIEAGRIQMENMAIAVRTLERIVTGVDVIIAGFVELAGDRGAEVRRHLELVRSESEQKALEVQRNQKDQRRASAP